MAKVFESADSDFMGYKMDDYKTWTNATEKYYSKLVFGTSDETEIAIGIKKGLTLFMGCSHKKCGRFNIYNASPRVANLLTDRFTRQGNEISMKDCLEEIGGEGYDIKVGSWESTCPDGIMYHIDVIVESHKMGQ